ncbi:unnamed protein product, partial [Prorocentrum cordatum]
PPRAAPCADGAPPGPRKPPERKPRGQLSTGGPAAASSPPAALPAAQQREAARARDGYGRCPEPRSARAPRRAWPAADPGKAWPRQAQREEEEEEEEEEEGAGGGGGGGKKRDRHADGRPVPGVAPLSGPGPAAPPSTFRPRSASGMHPRPCEEARRKRNAGRIVPQKHGGNGEGNVGWRSASKEIEKKGGRFRPTSEVAQSAADPESGKRHAWPRAQGGMGAQH